MKITYKGHTVNFGSFRRHLTLCNAYTLLWCMYFAQYTLQIGETIISQMILAVNLLISLFLFVKCMLLGRLPLVLKVLALLILVFTVYGMQIILAGETFYIELTGTVMPSFSYIRAIYISVLPIFAYYYFARKGQLTEHSLRIWVPVFFIVSLLIFQENIMKRLEYSTSDEGMTNNAGYLFLALMPSLVFYNRKPIIQYTLLLMMIVMMLVSVKKGAIIIGVLSSAWFLFNQYKIMTRRQKLILTGFCVCFVAFFVYIFSMMLATDTFFLKRFLEFSDGNASRRDVIYITLWQHFINDDNPLHLLFGNGAYHTLRISENLAHNDWLEILLNQGIFGVIIYAAYWVLFGVYLFKVKRVDAQLFSSLGMLFIIYFLRTFFSMSYADIAFCVSPVFGFCFAQSYKKLHQQ